MKFFEDMKGFKIVSKFSRKYIGKFRKFWKYEFVRVLVEAPPETSEIRKKLIKKSMETCKILKIFTNFYLKMLIS